MARLNITRIRNVIRKNLYSNTLENQEEMDKFVDAKDLPKLSQGYNPSKFTCHFYRNKKS
jgi:hypothetical protein